MTLHRLLTLFRRPTPAQAASILAQAGVEKKRAKRRAWVEQHCAVIRASMERAL